MESPGTACSTMHLAAVRNHGHCRAVVLEAMHAPSSGDCQSLVILPRGRRMRSSRAAALVTAAGLRPSTSPDRLGCGAHPLVRSASTASVGGGVRALVHRRVRLRSPKHIGHARRPLTTAHPCQGKLPPTELAVLTGGLACSMFCGVLGDMSLSRFFFVLRRRWRLCCVQC